jgi:hypothetical protein
MTEEAADVLDAFYTKNTVMPDLSKPGYFARKYGMTVKLDPETTFSITQWAETEHLAPAQIISNLVRKELAGAVTT